MDDGGSRTTGGHRRPADFDALPATVRAAAVGLAARVLAVVPADQLPAMLVPVARFTPHKRARAGAAPLTRALQSDTGFRALVAQYLPGAVDGRPGDAATDAARAFLTGAPDGPALADRARRSDELAALHARVSELTSALDDVAARLADSAGDRSGADADHRADPAVVAELRAENAKLRQRLRDQGVRRVQSLDRVRQERDAARAELSDVRERAELEHSATRELRQRLNRESRRADAAQRALIRYRTSEGQARADADRRIDLLLETVQRATAGLRRQWALSSGGADPADVMIRDFPTPARTGARPVDATVLVEWLALPAAHLIIDGYNVTKTGYPALPLERQRERLIRTVGALAVRTGADATIVFDGADVVAPPAHSGGVRVVFSPPGVIADDVVRDLAAAEPPGRVVVVVSSDREVVDGARARGARTAPSAVLLDAIGL